MALIESVIDYLVVGNSHWGVFESEHDGYNV